MQAQDIMTKNVDTIGPTDTIAKLVKTMSERRVSGLPVLDADGRIVGIVTEGDLLRRTELGTETHHSALMTFLTSSARLAREYVQTHGQTVADIMTSEVAAVRPEASLAEIVNILEARHIKRVPVIQDGACVGVVSRADIVRALGAALVAPVPPADDAAIEARIARELGAAAWANPSLSVEVKKGCAEMRGTVFHESEREAMHTLVKGVPGVRSCRDALIWIEPLTGMVCSAGNAEIV